MLYFRHEAYSYVTSGMGTFVISQHPVKNCLSHVQSRGWGWVGGGFNWKGRVVGGEGCWMEEGRVGLKGEGVV